MQKQLAVSHFARVGVVFAILGLVRPVFGGVDVRVNDPSTDTPEHTTQTETTIAVHGSTVCTGYRDIGQGGFPHQANGFARSGALGAGWVDNGMTGAVTPGFILSGDPALVAHRASGTFYYVQLAVQGGLAPSQTFIPIIAVGKSTDDCNSFPTVANASPGVTAASVCGFPPAKIGFSCTQNSNCDSSPGSGDGVCSNTSGFQDKPWIAVDSTGGLRDGNIYVCWRGTTSSGTGVLFSRSTDGGATFTGERVLGPSQDICYVAVGPGGEVYVSNIHGSNMEFRRSLDGGVTWAAPVQVNTASIRGPGADRLRVCTNELPEFGTGTEPTLNGDIETANVHAMAVDRTDGPYFGNIYIAWSIDPAGATDNSDVVFSRSTDGGQTWSAETQIGGGTSTDQFFPVIAVGGKGTVAFAWYDRRNDPINNYLIDLYTALSRDGGATIDPVTRVTDVSFPVAPIRNPTTFANFDSGTRGCFMGDYIGITADDQYFYYLWTDNRDTVTSTNYPSGRPDPDVFFDRLPIPLLTCGNHVVDGGEQCDDGNTVSGDGCSPDCKAETIKTFVGTAQGGAIDLVVNGVSLHIVTNPGETANQVAAKLAAAMDGNATLIALGVNTSFSNNRIVTTANITSFHVTDPGFPGLVSTGIPALPQLASASLFLLVLGVGMAVICRRAAGR